MNSLEERINLAMLLRLLGTYFWSNLYIRATWCPLWLCCASFPGLYAESDYSPEKKNVLWCMAFRSSNPSSDH